jgi:hypothetical protein
MEKEVLFEKRRIPIAKGEIFIKMGKDITYEDTIKNPDRHIKNIIVDVCSELIAQWAFTGTISLVSEHIKGIMTLAVGTGDPLWDLQNPPAETSTQTDLVSEFIRKTFSSITYVDPISGNPSAIRTNIVDFTTTFLEAEAVGPLVEMGLFGGNGAELTEYPYGTPIVSRPDSTATSGGSMCNYRTFPVINKSATSKLIIVWRLTF